MDRIITARELGSSSYEVTTRSGHVITVAAGAQAPSDPGPAPMELLLASLATCAAATWESVVAKMRLPVSGFEVAVDADRATSTPRVWTDVAVRFQVRSEAPIARLERAVELTRRTCSVSVMLERATSISERLYVVAEVDVASTVEIRHRLLRSGMPRSAVAMPGDADATWFGVVSEGRIEGTAGVFGENSPEGDSRHRLRAMATSESIRGSGLGRMLVEAVCDHVVEDGGSSVWASVRTPASGFYTKLGFEVTSDEYHVDGIGPHLRMRRDL
jgi:putative redox protein